MTAHDAGAPPSAALLGLLPALRRLDRRLAAAAACVPLVYGAHAAVDRFRGLYVSADDVDRLLARAPAEPLFAGASGEVPDEATRDDEALDDRSPLAWLAGAYELDAFDVDALVLALAPELDLRYERLYAYLHDDVTRRRPTVDLALGVLCADAAERLERRARFAPDAPLVRHRLLDVVAPDGAADAPLLAHALAVDDQIVNLLLAQDTLDRRLAGACRYADTAATPATTAAHVLGDDAMARLVARARTAGPLHFHGPRGTGKRETAAALAASLGAPLLVVDLALLLERGDFARLLALALRDAWLRGAVAYLRGADVLLRDDRTAARLALESELAHAAGLVVLASAVRWPGAVTADTTSVAFGVPATERRAALWRAAVAGAGLDAPAETADALATRFRLTPRQITVAATAAARDVADGAASDAALFAGARAASGDELAALATRLTLAHDWTSLVLPDDALTQLRELCARVACRGQVLDAWGFGRTLSRGRGLNALFSGPSGTGKTMAAEVVAHELGLDLYRVELAGVVSKYIGETEKNLDRVFTAAERSNAILLFDEADALFGKRSEVHDAHDRYANVEISYLLQRMEEYDGVAILSTNLRGNLDAAFIRRLTFMVHFPAPDEVGRRRIWRTVWPGEVPLAPDVDLDAFARQFPLSGGNISNIALAAAFLAADDGGVVAHRHLTAATRREYQKLGKTLTAEELGPLAQAGA